MLSLAPFSAALLVLFRCAGMCMTAPILGARTVPTTIRIVFTMAMTLLMCLDLPTAAAGNVTWSTLAGRGLLETLLGMMAGWSARLAMECAFFAGHAAGSAMGFNYGAMLDPSHGEESTSVAQLMSMAALVAAATLGLHRECVAWLIHSLRVMPPGADFPLRDMAMAVVQTGLDAFGLGVRLAFPTMAAVALGQVALGLAGKSAQQLNVQSLAFCVTTVCGGGMIYLTAPTIVHVASEASRRALAF